MLIICDKHGPQPGVLTSPDLQTASAGSGLEIVDVLYMHKGTLADEFHVSRQFANAHGLTEGTEPLPDVYGDWIRLLRPSCVKCFERQQNGLFDDDHRWKPAQ